MKTIMKGPNASSELLDEILGGKRSGADGAPDEQSEDGLTVAAGEFVSAIRSGDAAAVADAFRNMLTLADSDAPGGSGAYCGGSVRGR